MIREYWRDQHNGPFPCELPGFAGPRPREHCVCDACQQAREALPLDELRARYKRYHDEAEIIRGEWFMKSEGEWLWDALTQVDPELRARLDAEKAARDKAHTDMIAAREAETAARNARRRHYDSIDPDDWMTESNCKDFEEMGVTRTTATPGNIRETLSHE